MRKLLLLPLLIWVMSTAVAQTGNGPKKYLVYLTDKTNTPYSLNEPEAFLSQKSLDRRARQQITLTERDLPVNPEYVQDIKEAGIEVWYTSRWFNAVVVEATEAQLATLNGLHFVKQSRSLNKITSPQGTQSININLAATTINTALEPEEYGPAFHQADMLGVTKLHDFGYRGEGLTIAVLDAGFPGVNTISAFEHLFQNNQFVGVFDFVEKKANTFTSSSHGTAVLSTMAAYEPGKMIGTAYKANYLLLRTEDAASEHNIEEVNWLLAAEYADSAGADVINSSLGYSVFDAPSTSYTYEQMDGNTTIVSRAADMAAAVGMLVVVSAGNEGSKPWRYVTAPADADSVLTVGAIDSLGNIASFSSRGPSANGRFKPDVVAMGLNAYVINSAGNVVKSNGTSFSGPIMAGFATVLWQANIFRTNYELIELIRQTGDRFENPDNTYGYGIPNYNRLVTDLPEESSRNGVIVVNPVTNNTLTLLFSEEWFKYKADLQILDMTGKIILQQKIYPVTEQQTINLQHLKLSKGVYICNIQSGKQVATVRFVKL